MLSRHGSRLHPYSPGLSSLPQRVWGTRRRWAHPQAHAAAREDATMRCMHPARGGAGRGGRAGVRRDRHLDRRGPRREVGHRRRAAGCTGHPADRPRSGVAGRWAAGSTYEPVWCSWSHNAAGRGHPSGRPAVCQRGADLAAAMAWRSAERVGRAVGRGRLPDHGRSNTPHRGGRAAQERLAGQLAPGRPTGCVGNRLTSASSGGAGEPDRSGAALW